MFKTATLIAIAAAVPALIPAPAAAQTAVQNGVLVIYGSDKCPTDADGNEIVVCSRRPEEERFRIPKELRELQVTPENKSWAVRQADILSTGNNGINTCSTVGIIGSTGCFAQEVGKAKAEAKARAKAEAENPYHD